MVCIYIRTLHHIRDFRIYAFMQDRFDPAKDAINCEKHKLPPSFGDEIFKDDDHLLIPSIRPQDGEERFKVVGQVGEKLFTGGASGGVIYPVSCPCEGATQ
ncbi:MAG: BrnT family toxin [Gemmobacter sp.]